MMMPDPALERAMNPLGNIPFFGGWGRMTGESGYGGFGMPEGLSSILQRLMRQKRSQQGGGMMPMPMQGGGGDDMTGGGLIAQLMKQKLGNQNIYQTHGQPGGAWGSGIGFGGM